MTDEPETQDKKFRKMAKELGCDEDEAAFEDKVRKVARPKPPEPSGEPGA